MNISTTHPAIRARAALVQRERDELIRADERREITQDIYNFIENNEAVFSKVPAAALMLLIREIEKKG